MECGNTCDNDGNMVLVIAEKLKTWLKYIENMFKEYQRPEKSNFNIWEAPKKYKFEVERTIKLVKHREAIEADEIPTVLLWEYSHAHNIFQ